MKRQGHLIERVADMDNLMLAFWKAQRGKAAKMEVVRYQNHLTDNLLAMQEHLLTGQVDAGHYHSFTIYEPKERHIYASSFDERVLHHALMNVCHPYFDRHLIYDTYATRVGKGTYAALDRAHKMMPRYKYVAKLDVRKYFDSIDHAVLKRQLRSLFKDPLLLSAFDRIIDTYCSSRPGLGVPIGNLTSQYFANHYLSCYDHYVKERLAVPAYIRYMDDMLLFGNDKALLRKQVKQAEHYLSSNLLLTLKPPQIASIGQGVSFLGYHLREHQIALNSRSRNRFSRLLSSYTRLLQSGTWSQEDYRSHLVPVLAFVRYAYTKKYRMQKIEKQTAGLVSRESRWQLEQQRQELPRVESQQQHSFEPQQQPRLSRGISSSAYVVQTDAVDINRSVSCFPMQGNKKNGF